MSNTLIDDNFRDWLESLRVQPGDKPKLHARDPSSKPKKMSREDAAPLVEASIGDLNRLQYLLYADAKSSMLIVLQGRDAAGKDGTIRHVLTGMNPQSTRVASFKQPTFREASRDFLWRAHLPAPASGEVVIFNRSHYEDVLVVRVHDLVPKSVWKKRYDQINAFESLLASHGTVILKFFLEISPDEQLKRFRKRLDDPARNWKISESDYTERKYWDAYTDAYEEALERTSTAHAPWYVIPSERKWVRNLAVARIIADHLEALKLKTPPVRVDLDEIRRRYHEAASGQDT